MSYQPGMVGMATRRCRICFAAEFLTIIASNCRFVWCIIKFGC